MHGPILRHPAPPSHVAPGWKDADDGAYDLYRALGFEGEATGFRRYLR